VGSGLSGTNLRLLRNWVTIDYKSSECSIEVMDHPLDWVCVVLNWLSVQATSKRSTKCVGSSGMNWLLSSFSKNPIYSPTNTLENFTDFSLEQVYSLGSLSRVYNSLDTPLTTSDPPLNYRVLCFQCRQTDINVWRTLHKMGRTLCQTTQVNNLETRNPNLHLDFMHVQTIIRVGF
jgi:hypothetical protein